MILAFFFMLLSACLVYLASTTGSSGWLLLWPALSFAILALAYAGLGSGVFGKQSNGRLAWWALVLLLPFLLLVWGLWHLNRLLSGEDVGNEVAPGIWAGRRPLAHELPTEVVLVVDLTAEFPVPIGICEKVRYFTLPTLDSGVPSEKRFRAALAQVAATAGPVFIHCAAGHGRSAMFAAALLLHHGIVNKVSDAEARLRRARPGIRLNRAQRKLLGRLFVEQAGAAEE